MSIDFAVKNPTSRISIIPAVPSIPVIKAINAAHNNKVCSTWGNFNFKTFDGDVFHFPGTCNYVYSSHCKSDYEDFNIQIQRTVTGNAPAVEKITMRLSGVVVQINGKTVKVDGNIVQLPFSGSGVQIEKRGVYLKVSSKLGLVLMWNEDDSLLMELDEKYANQTCGLCGDYNGISVHNEFTANGVQITETQFGNLQRIDGPTEECQDVPPTPESNCTDDENICENILLGSAFSLCHALVDVQPYIEACVQDLCRCDKSVSTLCTCDTFSEYSRQCAHAGGHPSNWRTNDLCPRKCPFNMEYQECDSPCSDTCSNPDRAAFCDEHCLEGCYCPKGTVFDDINNAGCIPIERCPCTNKGDTYASGASYTTECKTCVCSSGKWNCNDIPCSSTCSLEGGSHITTYDKTHYSIHGDCNYVLTKTCDGGDFTVVAELRKCGLTETETCLKSIMILLNGGETTVVIKPCGSVFVNSIYTQLPVSAASVTIFRPSSFYIIVHTNLGLQIVVQVTPSMQVNVVLDPKFKGQACGLCGNFNDKEADDFQSISGVIEGTAASFANTWKSQANCPNIKNIYEDPCSLSVENEQYATHWCGLLTDPTGPFAECHSQVNPTTYKKNCQFDTCNCQKSEDCMCASLSSYTKACAAKGVLLTGWRTGTPCSKYTELCPKTLNYTDIVNTCQPTCRSRTEPDVTCNIKFVPVDGCTCTKGFFMDDAGKCVPETDCPCYYKGSPVPSGEVVHEDGVLCSCTQGQLSCIGSSQPECAAPMVYFDCKNATGSTKGAECQKSCHTLDMECYRTTCVSGCVCPDGLVSDGKGGCIKEEQCPCVHNEATYQPGEQIKVKCNTCTCKNRMWTCTNEPCLGTCSVYGDGHYITFDGKRYNFNGDCEYILAQDHCGKAESSSSFRVITENIPCGTTGTTCSKAIKVYIGGFELILTDEQVELVERDQGAKIPYKIRHMGIYLVVEADNGLILLWDKKTGIFIKLSKDFEGTVCGLCGNYDGNGNNDFTTRSLSVVGDAVEFGNSWKLSPTCPDMTPTRDPCTANPYRKSWSQKQCSIINSKVFSSCHSQIDPTWFYEACVVDSCACDTGGDCECLCNAIAAYALACGEAGICVAWRTPSICPIFCDYYNPEGLCEWHYKPCGNSCMKTCTNPTGKCLYELRGLEGCYPSCPANKPYFNEDTMECVAQCGCYDNEGKHYQQGSPVPTKENCQTCECTMSSVTECKYDKKACYCMYNGTKYNYNDVIYNTRDGTGGCLSAICKENGTIIRDTQCPTTSPVPTITSPSPKTSSAPPHVTSICVKQNCEWSRWFDVSYPEPGLENGDFDTFQNIRAKGFPICAEPEEIECRAERFPDTPLKELEQNVKCSRSLGLVCYNKDQLPPICYNYEIRVKCCDFRPCSNTSTTLTTITPKPITKTTPIHKTTIPKTTTTHTTPRPITSSPVTTPCEPTCKWTTWIDVHMPGVGKNEGDYETYDNIRLAGKNICRKPDGIQCRAEKFPEMPIGHIGQVVQCNLTFGLICKNEEQDGDFKECLNYQVKVLCCDDYSHCSTITPTTTTPTTTLTTTSTTTPTTTPTTTHTTTPTTTTPTTTHTTTPTTHTTTTPTTTHTTTTPTTTHTTTPTTHTTHTPTTHTQLQLHIQPQTPPTTYTYNNYTYNHTTTATTTHTPTPTTPTTTTPTTTHTPTPTTHTTTTPTTTHTTTTPYNYTPYNQTNHNYTYNTRQLHIHTTTPTTTDTTTTPTTHIQPQHPQLHIQQLQLHIQPQHPTLTHQQLQLHIQPHTYNNTYNHTHPQLHLTTTPTTHTTTTPTTTHTTTPTTHTTTTPTTIPTTPEICQPQCKWTPWIDVDVPKSGKSEGDFETYDNIRASGKAVCKKPEGLQCRAEKFPDVPIGKIGQVVQCNVTVGLICKNEEQIGDVYECLNYQVKILCCNDYSHCSSTPTVTTSPITTLPTIPTTSCFCHVDGHLYLPGEVIYNKQIMLAVVFMLFAMNIVRLRDFKDHVNYPSYNPSYRTY
ncbi:hypothetical protein GDO86_008695 [Hymenochirus boettgeri]|uniref:VWFD domain-containing protein n=1 Tax=Hymenochirus boettgeri TaxID=247094 RepID=A0A8T2J2R3_9PIPI|nr:hypothetical protein GDO86_008695 [Hymenochirus boettgeri]